MQHHPGGSWPADADPAAVERLRPLVLDLCRELDPAVQALLTPFHWPDGDMLDIALRLGGQVRHLELSGSQLALMEHNPDLLRQALTGVIADLHRAAAAVGDHTDVAAAPALPDTDFFLSPAAEVVDIQHSPDVLHLPPATPVDDSQAAANPENRATLDQTIALTRHILAALDPEAAVSFDEYTWHGDLTLDIRVSLHGHDHHYEITAARARLVLRDHHMLEHDLEGVLQELRREAAHAHS